MMACTLIFLENCTAQTDLFEGILFQIFSLKLEKIEVILFVAV